MEPIYEKEDVKIYIDEDPHNPRDWDNLGTMVCFHGRYTLGDKDHGYKQSDYNSWEELEKQIEKDNKPCTILPIYMLDHSGLTVRTTAFNDSWDSGQIGFIYCSEEKAKDGGAWAPITMLKAEVETYDEYLRGDVYGYERGDDSCWGFYGYTPEELADAVLKGEV